MPFAVAYLTVTVCDDAADSVTSNVAFTEPELPSVTTTSLIDKDGCELHDSGVAIREKARTLPASVSKKSVANSLQVPLPTSPRKLASDVAGRKLPVNGALEGGCPWIDAPLLSSSRRVWQKLLPSPPVRLITATVVPEGD